MNLQADYMDFRLKDKMSKPGALAATAALCPFVVVMKIIISCDYLLKEIDASLHKDRKLPESSSG